MKNILISETQYKRLLKNVLKESSFPDTPVATFPFGNRPGRNTIDLEAKLKPRDEFKNRRIEFNNKKDTKHKYKFTMPRIFDAKKRLSTWSGDTFTKDDINCQECYIDTRFGALLASFSKNCALFRPTPYGSDSEGNYAELSPEMIKMLFERDGYRAEIVGDNKYVRVFYKDE